MRETEEKAMRKKIEKSTAPEQPTIRGRMVAPAEVAGPDFTAEWSQIREDLTNEAEGALRIGLNLIRIRDALKPLGLWLAELQKHGMSQPQASRYIRYAQLPERDRAAFQRTRGFSLSEAIGESRRKKRATSEADHYSSTNSPAGEAPIPEDELVDRLAEVEQRVKLAITIVEAGEQALAKVGEPQPEEFADDRGRWQAKLSEVADAVLAVIHEHLEEELRKRLLPGRS